MNIATIRATIEKALPIALPIAKTAGTYGAVATIALLAYKEFFTNTEHTKTLKSSLQFGTAVALGRVAYVLQSTHGRAAGAISGVATTALVYQGLTYARLHGTWAAIKAVSIPVVLTGAAAAYKYKDKIAGMIANLKR